jgi:hypothetical protein
MAVLMNKCTEDDEHEDIVKYYMSAKAQAKATNLPDLSKAPEQVLMIQKIGGVKKSYTGDVLEKAQHKVMAAIKDDVVVFVRDKLASVRARVKTKTADVDTIVKSVTDDSLLK